MNESVADSSESETHLYYDTPGCCQKTRFDWLTLTVVWLAGMIYLAVYLRRGWVPFDAGMLAETADRVLHGQVPYRNFMAVYTGGLTYLDALAFRLFGENLLSLRIPLFVFFLGWVPSVYFIARRFVAPVTAGIVTLLSIVWSVPNYPEAMPSWYNLFFATWGVLALLRFTETKRKRWLWIAGLCGGLSFLIKIVALYFVAAAVLFFVFCELSVSDSSPQPKHRGLAYRIFISASLLLFLSALVELILQRPTCTNFFYFILPSGTLVAFLLREVWVTPSPQDWPRFRRLSSMILPFLAGVLVPVVVFLAYYARIGALKDWLFGVLGSNVLVLRAATAPPPPLLAVGLAPMAAVLILAHRPDPAVRQWALLAAGGLLAVTLVLAHFFLFAYVAVGLGLPVLVPIVALMAFCWPRRWKTLEPSSRKKAFLLVAAAILCALIQFPFSAPIYFCYIAPLVILAIVGLLSTLRKPNRAALSLFAVFYLAFAVWLQAPGFFNTMALPADRPYNLARLKLPRAAGIRVKPDQASEYELLTHVVLAHAHGPYIWCGPDCPEVYFLSGRMNPTPTILDVKSPDFTDPLLRQRRVLSALALRHVHAVVLASAKDTGSTPLAKGLRNALKLDFPVSERIGDFEVRWRP